MSAPGYPKVYLKDDAYATPEGEPVYYVLAENGLFRAVNMPLYSAVAKVEDGVRGLQAQAEKLDLHLPKIPQVLIERAVGFFHQVYEEYRSESIVFIYFHPQKRQFCLVPPPQTVTVEVSRYWVWARGEVEYEPMVAPKGWMQVGDFHSHGSQPAFQSWQDKRDAEGRDGLHIVAGRVTRNPDFDAVFTVCGRRFDLEFEDICDGFDQPTLPPPGRWMQKVTCRTEVQKSTYYSYGNGGGQYEQYGYSGSDYYGKSGSGHDGFGKKPLD